MAGTCATGSPGLASIQVSLTAGYSSPRHPTGLFVLVEAVERIGALRLTSSWLASAEKLAPGAGPLVAGFAVGVGNLVNNLPLGLIAGATVGSAHATGLMAQAALSGVDLGANLSVTGSLATILWLLALRKEGLDVSFWTFLKVGAVAMPVALVLALRGAVRMQMLL